MRKVAIFLTLLLSTSCVEIAILASIKTADLATREKSIADSGKDLIISSKLIKDLASKKLKTPSNMVDITVSEGRVLMTGVVQDEENAKNAVNIAWKNEDVKEVIDEIQLVEKLRIFRSSGQYLKDTIITSNIQSKLLFTKNIASINYEIVTVNNIVYLLGIANSNAELNKVSNIAAKVGGVNRVVSHVILQNDGRRG
ncbi:MAG: osmotically-inducible protein OsmY [Rickettsiales bacterium]|jgi:osmotically-inducible protein OsmY